MKLIEYFAYNLLWLLLCACKRETERYTVDVLPLSYTWNGTFRLFSHKAIDLTNQPLKHFYY